MKNIKIIQTTEDSSETGKPIKVLWLSFECKGGGGAMLNINNLVIAQKNLIGRNQMLRAIKEYNDQENDDIEEIENEKGRLRDEK